MSEASQLANSAADQHRLLISAKEAATLLSVSPRTLWALTQQGAVPVVRVGRRTLYSPAALREWIVAASSGGDQQ